MEQVKTLNVAVVGGGHGCKAIMNMILAKKLSQLRMKLIGLASTNPKAVGYCYAQEKGIYTTTDYRDLYKLKDLHMIIELTGRDEVAHEIARTKRDHIRLMDHVAAHLFWDVFDIEEKRIAERKRAQEALEQEKTEKEMILDSLLEHVVYQNLENKVLWANRAARESVDKPLEELVGHYCYEVWAGRESTCEDCPVAKARDTGKPQTVEKATPDGRWWYIQAYPIRDDSGDILGMSELTLDITERKRAEEELREREERYRAVLEACPDPVVVYDMEGKCSYINTAFTTVFGWTPEELIDKRLDYVPEENWPETQLIIDRVLAGESFSGLESRRYTKDGDILDVSISAAIHLSRDGIPMGSVHFLRDITERKRTEKALEQRKEELKAKAQSLEEVNTALKVLLKQRQEDKAELEEKVLSNVKELILPYVETLKKSRLGAEHMAYVSIIESNLTDIVSPFLRKLSSKYLGLTRKELQIADLVKLGNTTKEIADLLNVSTRAIEFHRENIRAKLGLKNQRVNLRTHLLSLE